MNVQNTTNKKREHLGSLFLFVADLFFDSTRSWRTSGSGRRVRLQRPRFYFPDAS